MHVVFLCFAVLLSSFSSYAEKLSIGWELWYPYQYHNKKQELDGIDIAVTNAILEQLSHQVSFIELPWARHVNYIKTGEIQIAMGASFTPERETFSYYSIPYRSEQVNLYTLKNKPLNINTLDDVIDSEYIIGVESGYFYGDLYDELIKRPEFEKHISEVLDVEQNVKRLLKGKIDALLVDPYTMKSFIKKYRMSDEITNDPIVIYKADIHFMLSKKTTSLNLLKEFNNAIEELKRTGRLDQILEN